jgi:ActR/RegA family two-component response regulator/thiamine kinase-like enzyme
MALPSAQTSIRPRVLVVDDNPEICRLHGQLLRRWRCSPFIAQGKGWALIEDARIKAIQHKCHLALVDLRLIDDDEDISGLSLIAELKPTLSLVVTAHANLKTANTAIMRFGAIGVLAKDDFDGIRSHIFGEFREHFGTELAIDWDDQRGQQQLTRDLKIREHGDEEVTQVITRLYQPLHQHKRIAKVSLQSVAQQQSLGENDPAPQVHSIVFEAHPFNEHGKMQREIIKLAAAAKIHREIDNYHEYVAPHIAPNRSARIESHDHACALWSIGGIRYTKVSNEDQIPFSEYYVKHSSDKIRAALIDLFHRTLNWKELARDHSGFSRESMYSYYVSIFPKIAERLDAISDDSTHFNLAGHRLLNPTTWLKRNLHKSTFMAQWRALTHGDLHSNNVFVNRHSETLVIDFERTGPGYVLRDYVELEADVRLRLFHLRSNQLDLAYRLDYICMAPETPRWQIRKPSHSTHTRPINGAFQKALSSIATIRELAYETSRADFDYRAYYWALLIETMISVLRNYKGLGAHDAIEFARSRALLSAALICERLERWHDKWLQR